MDAAGRDPKVWQRISLASPATNRVSILEISTFKGGTNGHERKEVITSPSTEDVDYHVFF